MPEQRQGVSAASAVSAKGAFWFATYARSLNAALVITELQRTMRGWRRPPDLVLDNLSAHKTRALREYGDALSGKLALYFLPGYAPESNPGELAWSYTKRTDVAHVPLQAGERLAERAQVQLSAIGHRPELARSFFKHPTVTYVFSC